MSKKRVKFKVVIMSLAAMLTFLAVPSAVYADEAEGPMLTEEGNMYINLPGKDVVAVGTEESAPQPSAAVQTSQAVQTTPTSQTGQTGAIYSYQTSSFPETSAHPDTVPYLCILALAVVAALIYRQNMVLDKRNDFRDEHDAEMEEFRLQCESARQAQ